MDERPFNYLPLNPAGQHVIRLVTILPLQNGETNESPLRCYINHISISVDQLALGKKAKDLTSRFPTISFGEHVVNRPVEEFETPHSLALADKEKNRSSKGLGRMFRRFTQHTKTSKERSQELNEVQQDYFRRLRTNAEAHLTSHAEDTGGGYTIASSDGGISTSNNGIFLWEPQQQTRIIPRRQPHPKARHIPTMLRKFVWGNYVALSYAWGTVRSENKIHLQYRSNQADRNQIMNSGTLSIHKNLEDALRQFRTMPYFRNGGRVWIDAICINQQDDVEKESQIKIMAEIYQRAGNIVVWLGQGTPTLYDAIDAIQSSAALYRTEWQEAFDDCDPEIARLHRNGAEVESKLRLQMYKDAARMEGASFYANNANGKIYEFFNLPYWRRLWIIQELAMGTADMAFVLGDRVTEWRYIRDIAFLLAHISDHFAAYLPTLPEPHIIICHVAQIAHLEIAGHRKVLPQSEHVWRDRFEEFPSTTRFRSGYSIGPLRGTALWQAFRLMSYAKCSEPKDRVFGLLALPGLPNLGIVPDKSKSTVQVFKDFTKACITQSTDSLGVFCLIDGAAHEINGEHLSSWVPDISSERETGIIEGKWKAGEKWTRFQVEGYRELGAEPSVRFDADGNLECTAWVLDTVDGIGAISSLDPDANDPRFASDLVQPSRDNPWHGKTAVEISILHCCVAGTDENGTRDLKGYGSLLDAFAHSDAISVQHQPSNQDFVVANAQLLTGKLSKDLLVRDGTSRAPEDLGETSIARQTMASRTKRKRLMVTGRGMLGLVPNSVRVGDVVIIIRGHGRPVIASRVENDESEYYGLRGEAYVNGMMRGEMMEDTYEKEWRRITFV
jgi:hypothetical protein